MSIKRWSMVGAVVVIIAVGYLEVIPGWDRSTVVTALLASCGAAGVNIMFGYAGMLSLGNAAFAGLAAYPVGMLIADAGWSFWPAAAVGLAGAVAVSWCVGRLLVKVPGFYFAAVTLGLGVAFEGLVRAFPDRTGGASGLVIRAEPNVGPWAIASVESWFVAACVLTALTSAATALLVRARAGRVLGLVRQDELAAEVLGVDVFAVKRHMFVAGAAITAGAGVASAAWQRVLVPESVGLPASLNRLTVAVVGGLGSISGPVLGAVSLTWIEDVVSGNGAWTEFMYGVAFLGFVLAAPAGIAGAVSRLGLARRRRSSQEPAVASDHTDPADRASWSRSTTLGSSDLAAWTVERARSQREGLLVDEVTKHFGGLAAVDIVTVIAPPGRVTALVGANGAGKSTLMNLISGVEAPDEGKIYLDGQPLGGLTPARIGALGVARTFQVPRLVERLTAVDNVALGADCIAPRVFRTTRSEDQLVRNDALEALQRAGLGALAYRPVRALGAGERKATELVRALAWKPRVLLMDEPAAGLSHVEMARLKDWIEEVRSSGGAVLLVDHHLDFVGSVCDYAYVMDGGRIVREGPPSEIDLKGTDVPFNGDMVSASAGSTT